jgi:putative endonuclease
MISEHSSVFYFTYILQSETTKGLYIGYTSDIERRLQQHNESTGKYTSNKGKWVILFYKKFDNKTLAISLERKLKKWKSKKRVLEWIEKEKYASNNS